MHEPILVPPQPKMPSEASLYQCEVGSLPASGGVEIPVNNWMINRGMKEFESKTESVLRFYHLTYEIKLFLV